MKANEAPEKLYIALSEFTEDRRTFVLDHRTDYPICTEYTSTDAFIKKAKEAFCKASCNGHPPRSTCTSLGTCEKYDNFVKFLKCYMTQENKELLLRDLCARVPYHPKGHVVNACNASMCDEWLTCATFPMFTNIINNCRLYLRPMSSMTEKEKEELKTLCSIYIPAIPPTIMFEDYGIIVFTHHLIDNTYSFKLSLNAIDWLNAHHFDYRGLIEKGLALEAPEGMYNIKEK